MWEITSFTCLDIQKYLLQLKISMEWEKCIVRPTSTAQNNLSEKNNNWGKSTISSVTWAGKNGVPHPLCRGRGISVWMGLRNKRNGLKLNCHQIFQVTTENWKLTVSWHLWLKNYLGIFEKKKIHIFNIMQEKLTRLTDKPKFWTDYVAEMYIAELLILTGNWQLVAPIRPWIMCTDKKN